MGAASFSESFVSAYIPVGCNVLEGSLSEIHRRQNPKISDEKLCWNYITGERLSLKNFCCPSNIGLKWVGANGGGQMEGENGGANGGGKWRGQMEGANAPPKYFLDLKNIFVCCVEEGKVKNRVENGGKGVLCMLRTGPNLTSHSF